MKNTINSTLKFALVIALFCSAAFADGDMGNGGKTCTQNCGGFANTGNENENVDINDTPAPVEDALLTTVKEFLTQFGLM